MKYKNIFVGTFFGLLIVTGIAIHRDYGIPWDESIQRKSGTDVYNYVKGNDKKLLTNKDRFYGLTFELFLVFLETGDQDIRDVYLMRHLVNFLLFSLGVFFFYLLLLKRFKSVWLGLLGSVMLVLSPRIFAHSFYNTKDIAFMSVFIIAVYFVLNFLENKTRINALLAALSSAVLIDIRVMGVVLPALVAGIFLLDRVVKKSHRFLSLYGWLTAGFVVAFLPILWKYPVGNFIESFNYYSDTSTLYFGERVKSMEVPWHYTLGWIAVTTPVTYLVLAVSGIGSFAISIRQLRRKDLLIFGWFFVSLVTTIAFRASLSDAWRHMFFIYPPVLYFAVLALTKLSQSIKNFLLLLLVVNFGLVLTFMVSQHPYQNLYFNEFVKKGEGLEKNFELDYWGLAYKEGIEHIAKSDDSSLIKIAAENLPGETNIAMLKPSDRARFEFVADTSEADYYLTNYRKYKTDYYQPAYYLVEVNGVRILGVQKLK